MEMVNDVKGFGGALRRVMWASLLLRQDCHRVLSPWSFDLRSGQDVRSMTTT